MSEHYWWEYVQQVSGHALQVEIADRVGINQGTVSRWKGGESIRPATVAALARAYDRPVLEAFVAAGFLTAADMATSRPLLDISDTELLAEVARRLQAQGEEMSDQGGGPMRNSVRIFLTMTWCPQVQKHVVQDTCQHCHQAFSDGATVHLGIEPLGDSGAALALPYCSLTHYDAAHWNDYLEGTQ